MGSWEERFVLGVEHLISNNKFDGISIVYSKEFAESTNNNRLKVKEICLRHQLQSIEVDVDFIDQVNTYISIEQHLALITNKLANTTVEIILDISTMPRELIWTCLTLSRDENLHIEWIYYPPQKYDEEWLTRDPVIPRMALRKSGVTRYGKPTAVIVITGFDTERTLKAISYFEPSLVLLGIQTGEQYENLKRNANEQKAQLRPELCNIETFDFNAYSEDHGLKLLSEKIQLLQSNFNVLLTSQGPKPSAVTVYEIASLFPEVGLFYVPAREYNEKYSLGIKIDSMVCGNVN
jgi:hypothetical protein